MNVAAWRRCIAVAALHCCGGVALLWRRCIAVAALHCCGDVALQRRYGKLLGFQRFDRIHQGGFDGLKTDGQEG